MNVSKRLTAILSALLLIAGASTTAMAGTTSASPVDSVTQGSGPLLADDDC